MCLSEARPRCFAGRSFSVLGARVSRLGSPTGWGASSRRLVACCLSASLCAARFVCPRIRMSCGRSAIPNRNAMSCRPTPAALASSDAGGSAAGRRARLGPRFAHGQNRGSRRRRARRHSRLPRGVRRGARALATAAARRLRRGCFSKANKWRPVDATRDAHPPRLAWPGVVWPGAVFDCPAFSCVPWSDPRMHLTCLRDGCMGNCS